MSLTEQSARGAGTDKQPRRTPQRKITVRFWLGIILTGAAVAVAFWPRRGLLARWRAARALAKRCQQEDALKHILKEQVNGREPTLESVTGALEITHQAAAGLLAELENGGLITFASGSLRLRERGRELALHIIRAHRLWESYLAEQTGVEEAEWHVQAEYQEHLLSQREADRLAALLGHPARDPHGDVIPGTGEDLPAERGASLNTLAVNVPALITHVEDEPAPLYAYLAAEGLRPGVRVCISEKTALHVRFWGDGREHQLSPLQADSITVTPLPAVRPESLKEEMFLCNLAPGQRGRVLALSPACRGLERRRLLDLGFVPGTEVSVEMVSPGGDPTAYRLRGTVVALRRQQAGLIRVQPMEARSP